MRIDIKWLINFDKMPREFGWGIAKTGHIYIFVNPIYWNSAIAAVILSHKRKHELMMLIENGLPPVIIKDSKSIKFHPQKNDIFEQLI